MSIKVLGVFLLVVCFSSQSSCNQEMPSVCKEFFELPVPQQEKDFANYPIEKQLDIYRCGMKKRPPMLAMAYDIAKGGSNNIPVLLKSLETEEDELIQNHLIYIFQIMSRKGHLNSRQDIVQRIEKVISQMKYPLIKEEAQDALNEIEKNVKGGKQTLSS